MFQTRAAALAWLRSLGDSDSSLTCPFIVDEPDYGNVPRLT